MADKKNKKGDQPRRPWRDNIEALTMAIIMAVLLKYFIIEAYKIPTGSMQPTLLGNEETGIFDRILVDKLSYHYRDPERYEVAVFRYPLDRSKNFIKRIVGMPGEHLKIENGDVWTRPDEAGEWEVLRKPRSVQDAVLKSLIPEEGTPNWRATSGADQWKVGLHEIQARGSGSVRFPSNADSIRDNYTDGYPGKMAPRVLRRRNIPAENHVGDLRISGAVEALAGTETIELVFQEGGRHYRFRIPGPASSEEARPEVVLEGLPNGSGVPSVQAEEPFRLREGKRVRFLAQNIDDRLTLELGGRTVLDIDVPAQRDPAPATIRVSLEGAGADFTDVDLARDIYYTARRAKQPYWEIPEGHYFMLGDNTQDSSDSREWILKVYEPDEELLAETYGPGSEIDKLRGNYRAPNENPRKVAGGPDGTMVWMRDEWGELHHFPEARARSLTPETSPFVPRHLITGRALVVFWPIVPSMDIYRLSWIR